DTRAANAAHFRLYQSRHTAPRIHRTPSLRPSTLLEGAVADDGCAMHDASLRKVVRDGVVLGDAVIPERDVIHAPAPAQGKFGPPRMREQQGQEGIALARVELMDAG